MLLAQQVLKVILVLKVGLVQPALKELKELKELRVV